MDQTIKFSQNLTENSVNIRQFSWFKKVRKVRRTLKPNLEPPEPPFWPQKPNLEPTEPEKTERTSEPNQVRSKSNTNSRYRSFAALLTSLSLKKFGGSLI